MIQHLQSPVAQLVEQAAVNRLVASSSLAGGADFEIAKALANQLTPAADHRPAGVFRGVPAIDPPPNSVSVSFTEYSRPDPTMAIEPGPQRQPENLSGSLIPAPPRLIVGRDIGRIREPRREIDDRVSEIVRIDVGFAGQHFE